MNEQTNEPAPAEPTPPQSDPTPVPASDPPTPTPTPENPESTPQPATGAPEQDVAGAMLKAYSLDDNDDPQPEDPAEPKQDTSEKEEAPYEVEYPEDFAVDETFASIVAPIAEESGIDGKTFGGLTAKVINAINEAEYANMLESDAALKKDWGSEYNANMRIAKQEADLLMQRSGLTKQDLRPLQSPKGMRLLYAISQLHGETQAAGTGANSASETSWANEIMKNPNHPDYKAFHDPQDPRWRELNTRYNRAMGIQ